LCPISFKGLMQLNNEWNVMLLMLPPKHGMAIKMFIIY